MVPDLRDTGQIPDDPGYWDALAARVAAGAVRQSRRGALEWSAGSRVGWLAASLLLAAALTLLGPARDEGGPRGRAAWAEVLAPDDDVGRTILVLDRPPAIGALLFSDGPEARR